MLIPLTLSAAKLLAEISLRQGLSIAFAPGGNSSDNNNGYAADLSPEILLSLSLASHPGETPSDVICRLGSIQIDWTAASPRINAYKIGNTFNLDLMARDLIIQAKSAGLSREDFTQGLMIKFDEVNLHLTQGVH